MFYLLIVESTDLSATTLLSLFADNTVATLDNGSPQIEWIDDWNLNVFKLLDNAFDYIQIATYSGTKTLNSSFMDQYGQIFSISDLVEVEYKNDIPTFKKHAIVTAKGQAGDRKIAYRLCKDETCSQYSSPDTTGKAINVAATSIVTAKDAAIITPVLAISPRAVNSSSKWIFLVALAIISMVALEAIFASKLLAKKKQ